MVSCHFRSAADDGCAGVFSACTSSALGNLPFFLLIRLCLPKPYVIDIASLLTLLALTLLQVEFQNKFFHGDGYNYSPFTFEGDASEKKDD